MVGCVESVQFAMSKAMPPSRVAMCVCVPMVPNLLLL